MSNLLIELRTLAARYIPLYAISSAGMSDQSPSACLLPLLRQVRDTVFGEIDCAVRNGTGVKSKGRGCLRRELRLSWKKLAAFRDGGEREETLERVLVDVLPGTGPGRWCNQFCPGAGYCGANRTAADMVRDCGAEAGGSLDLVELKEWRSSGPDAEPLFAAIKAFSYHCAVAALVGHRVPPFDRWRMPAVRLWFMAPATYYGRFGGAERVGGLLDAVHGAVAKLKAEDGRVADVSFRPRPIVLDPALSPDEFRACFDWAVIERLVSDQTDAASPRDVLLAPDVGRIERWATSAFAAAGMFEK